MNTRVYSDADSPLRGATSAGRIHALVAGVRSNAQRLALSTCVILVAAGTAVRTLVLFQEGAPQRYQWVHFALGTGYEVMSGCVAALLIYPLATVVPRTARWVAFTLVTLLIALDYTDYVYLLLFQAHLPFSAVEYLPQLSNFTSSIRAAVLDWNFLFLVLLPVLLAGRMIWGTWPKPAAARPVWGYKAHALVLGGFLLIGGIANTASNSYVGKNVEDPLQFTPLQHILATRGQGSPAPATLAPDALKRLNPPDPQYPLVHAQAFLGCSRAKPPFKDLCTGVSALAGAGRAPNIVFIMLESFRAQEVGALKAGGIAGFPHDQENSSLTPQFDALARSGVLFAHFYGNGFQTRDGLVASYCGLYPNTGEPILQHYAKAHERCLPEVLRGQGYRTVWIHGGDADFDGQRDFLRHNGFERVIDRWNFPVGAPMAGWGVTDAALMDTTAQVLRDLPQPFFAGILTLTNHHPFETPADFTSATAPAQVPGEYGRFLQTMAYTDQALGRLFQQIRNEPYFQNTIFFIYGDHSVPQPSVRTIATIRDDLEWRHHIPLLVVAPWLKGPAVVDAPASQVDLPSLAMDLVESSALPNRLSRLQVPWAGRSPVDGGTHPVLLIRGTAYLGMLDNRSAALWTRGAWQQSGETDPAQLQWALDISTAERWSLERNRVTPGP